LEWAKLLLSLDPEDDPYSIRLILDQLAIRSGQFEYLIQISETPLSLIDWGQQSPNIQISLAMAHYKLKHKNAAVEALQRVASNYPWMIARLYRELEIDPIPKSVWGHQPRTAHEELLTTIYALRAKDIWNTPEALAFLKEALEPLDRKEPPVESPTDEISLNEARHVVLSEMPPLIALLPRSITNQRTSSSDPLPPPDSLTTYTNTAEPDREEWEEELQANEREFRGIQSWFTGMLARIGVNVNFTGTPGSEIIAGTQDFEIDGVAEALANSGVDSNELTARASRLEELRDRQIAAEARLRQLEQNLQNVAEAPSGDAGSEGFTNLNPTVEDDIDPDDTPGSGPAAASSSSYDDDANQRWLAGRGMLRLKEFIATHGADENKWKDNLDIDVTPATEYAHRITLLQKRSSRDFILNYALRQGAGADASDLIKRLVT
jgi:hypothetical protein